MTARPGGQATHDTLDSQTSAVLRRGGRLPPASGEPAARRAPRALLRRRMHLPRNRAERRAQIQQTTSQSHRPEMGKTLAEPATRAGVAARVPEPAGPKRRAGALGLRGDDDQVRHDRAGTLVPTATPHQAQTLDRRHSVRGRGTILALRRRYARQALGRLPRGQAGVSSGRLGPCTTEAAGHRSGTAGAPIGKASLTWAFSAAAGLLLRHTPAGHPEGARVAQKPGPGHALTLFAQNFARAVDDL